MSQTLLTNHTSAQLPWGQDPAALFKNAAAGDYVLSARTDMMALQNAGGDSFVTPPEFTAFLQLTYKLYQHRRDKPDPKSTDAGHTPKSRDEDAVLRDAAKQSQRKVSRVLSQFTTPLEMAAYLFQPRERREKSKAIIADSDEDMEAVIIIDNPGRSLQASIHAPVAAVSRPLGAMPSSAPRLFCKRCYRSPWSSMTPRKLPPRPRALKRPSRNPPPVPAEAATRQYVPHGPLYYHHRRLNYPAPLLQRERRAEVLYFPLADISGLDTNTAAYRKIAKLNQASRVGTSSKRQRSAMAPRTVAAAPLGEGTPHFLKVARITYGLTQPCTSSHSRGSTRCNRRSAGARSPAATD